MDPSDIVRIHEGWQHTIVLCAFWFCMAAVFGGHVITRIWSKK